VHGRLRNTTDEPLGTISELLAWSQNGCQRCSIILAEIQEAQNVSPRNLREHDHVQLVVQDRHFPIKIGLQRVEDCESLGELVMGFEDPGEPIFDAYRSLHAVSVRSLSS
jgi:hypothetical protein